MQHTFTLYVRAAKHPRFKGGGRIEASMSHNPDPLVIARGTYGETSVHTAFFKLQIKVPEEALRVQDIPMFEVEIPPEALTVISPSIEVEVGATEFDPSE
jgi:hypothetical protein